VPIFKVKDFCKKTGPWAYQPLLHTSSEHVNSVHVTSVHTLACT